MSTASFKYSLDMPLDEVRMALIVDGLSKGTPKKVAHARVNATLANALEDPTILKGLIQYLNWQDH